MPGIPLGLVGPLTLCVGHLLTEVLGSEQGTGTTLCHVEALVRDSVEIRLGQHQTLGIEWVPEIADELLVDIEIRKKVRLEHRNLVLAHLNFDAHLHGEV